MPDGSSAQGTSLAAEGTKGSGECCTDFLSFVTIAAAIRSVYATSRKFGLVAPYPQGHKSFSAGKKYLPSSGIAGSPESLVKRHGCETILCQF